MSPPPPPALELAGRLIALEASRAGTGVAGGIAPAVRVCEGLARPLARLAGPAGFAALASRALALAKAEVPALAPAKVGSDGALADFGGLGPAEGAEAGAALVAHLLGLLIIFIGEPLTLGLVRDAWPVGGFGSTGESGSEATPGTAGEL